MSDRIAPFEQFQAALEIELRRYSRRFWLRVGAPAILIGSTLAAIGIAIGVPTPLLPPMYGGAVYVVAQVAKRRLDRREALAEQSES